jgi:hypothetical protein
MRLRITYLAAATRLLLQQRAPERAPSARRGRRRSMWWERTLCGFMQ